MKCHVNAMFHPPMLVVFAILWGLQTAMAQKNSL